MTSRSTTPCELNSPHPSPRTTRTNSLHTYARAGQTHTFTRISASVSLMFLLRRRRGWATNSSSTVPRKTDPLSLRRTLPSVPGHFTCGPWRRRLRLTEDLLSTTPPSLLACGTATAAVHASRRLAIACGYAELPDQLPPGRQATQSERSEINLNEANHGPGTSGIQRAFVRAFLSYEQLQYRYQ